MRKPSVLGAAAILASTAALPSVAQAACAQYDPTCATYPMPSNAVGGNPGTARAEATRAAAGSYQRHRHHRDRSAYRANRTAQREAMNSRAYNNGYGPGYAGSGFWPADVAGAAVGTAGAIAAGAVNTAGAIATAPFRPRLRPTPLHSSLRCTAACRTSKCWRGSARSSWPAATRRARA